jgi:hypothetical protein
MTYTFEDGVLRYEFSNGCLFQQTHHPETNEPITIDTARAVLQQCLPSYEWERFRKIEGVEFEGVMCSATRDDQFGLMAVLMAFQLQGSQFAATKFEFENGSKLVLNQSNISDFVDVWMPFRQSFFETPESAKEID